MHRDLARICLAKRIVCGRISGTLFQWETVQKMECTQHKLHNILNSTGNTGLVPHYRQLSGLKYFTNVYTSLQLYARNTSRLQHWRERERIQRKLKHAWHVKAYNERRLLSYRWQILCTMHGRHAVITEQLPFLPPPPSPSLLRMSTILNSSSNHFLSRHMANIHPFNRLLHYECKVVTHKFMSTAIVHKNGGTV